MDVMDDGHSKRKPLRVCRLNVILDQSI